MKRREQVFGRSKSAWEWDLNAISLKVGNCPETLGDDIQLMVDAVQGHNPEPWTAAEAIRIGKAMQRFHLRWFEEPCAATDYAGYANVRRAVQIPISGGESSTSIFEFRSFSRSLDIAQPDTAHSGGIQECRKIATLAQSVSVTACSWPSTDRPELSPCFSTR